MHVKLKYNVMRKYRGSSLINVLTLKYNNAITINFYKKYTTVQNVTQIKAFATIPFRFSRWCL